MAADTPPGGTAQGMADRASFRGGSEPGGSSGKSSPGPIKPPCMQQCQMLSSCCLSVIDGTCRRRCNRQLHKFSASGCER